MELASKFIIGLVIIFMLSVSITAMIIELKKEKRKKMRYIERRKRARKNFAFGFFAGMLFMYLLMKFVF